MYPVLDRTLGLYGYWDGRQWALDPTFRQARNFHAGYAAVETDVGHWGLITVDGVLHSITSICNGKNIYGQESFAGFDGEFNPYEEYAIVCLDDHGQREWGVIDTALKYRTLPRNVFREASVVHCHGEYLLILIETPRDDATTRYGVFSLRNWRVRIPPMYSYIYVADTPVWVVARELQSSTGKGLAFYDLRRDEIVSDWFWGAISCWEGFGVINENGESPWQYVNERLEPMFDRTFDSAERFSHGLAAVWQEDDAGYIDTTGRMRLVLQYDELQPFNRFGWALANRDQAKWDIDIIDRKGQARIRHCDTAVFWDGDYPYFELGMSGMSGKSRKNVLLDMELRTIYRDS